MRLKRHGKAKAGSRNILDIRGNKTPEPYIVAAIAEKSALAICTYCAEPWRPEMLDDCLSCEEVNLCPGCLTKHECQKEDRWMCEFTADPSDPDSYHFLRDCPHCGHQWWSLHCIHEAPPRSCPQCKQVIIPPPSAVLDDDEDYYASPEGRLKLLQWWAPVICPGCVNEINPDLCHCGEDKRAHDDGIAEDGCSPTLGHSFVPDGCVCGYGRFAVEAANGR